MIEGEPYESLDSSRGGSINICLVECMAEGAHQSSCIFNRATFQNLHKPSKGLGRSQSGEILVQIMPDIKQLDTIRIHEDGSGSFNGEDAVNVFKLALIANSLKIELAFPQFKLTALKAAKEMTGLKTNNRAVQLDRILVMLEQAKTQVVYLEDTKA